MFERVGKPLWDVAVWECPSGTMTVCLAKKQRGFDELFVHQKPVFLFSIFTESGRGDVLRLRWNRIGVRKGTVPLFAKEMKRTCNLYAEGDESCPDSPKRKEQEYVFFCKNRPAGDSRTTFEKALKHAYCWLSPVRLRIWALILVQNGVLLNEWPEVEAWSCTEMVRRYAPLAPQKLKEKVQVVDDVLRESVTIL